ncbi:hypothetical protein QYE76_026968 [Lolium multiflorum]|uniref:F-box domain-containing protein n=1 Tax=Lolium multiflorum TaxID=4521 RepID=A0AAD8VF13_LOLMU|nr:hypothetical protein QYE76_026968 [Lolium multiflorum]
MATESPPKYRDRISDLPDGVLGHVLSFLPTREAGRAAVLARRWRDVFGHVHAVCFEERQGDRANDWYTVYSNAPERKSCSDALLNGVSAALLCLRRCAGRNVPVRSLRFAFDSYHWWDGVHVDHWLHHLLDHCRQELHLDLCFAIDQICTRCPEFTDEVDGASEDDQLVDSYEARWTYLLPRRLFSCAVLRTLRLTNCRLKPPEAINLPSLETLHLTAIGIDSGRSVQRLIASCPRLQDLTLENVRRLKRVSVLDKRLRRFSLRCCHNVHHVSIDASELRSLEYCGHLPAESLLHLHGSQGIPSSCKVYFSKADYRMSKCVGFRMLFGKIITPDTRLLHHGGSIERGPSAELPLFCNMTRLALHKSTESYVFIVAIRWILEQAPNLEVLSLNMEDDGRGDASVGPATSFSIPCLRLSVREINMVHYMGIESQRILARLLLRNAMVLEKLCVSFPRGDSGSQAFHKSEIENWASDNSEKIFIYFME